MTCTKENNLKNGWNRYCSVIDKLAKLPLIGQFFRNDSVFGLYLGCTCKQHDIHYSNEGGISRFKADWIFAINIIKQGIIQSKQIRSYPIAFLMWVGIRLGGMFVYHTWSSKGVQRYK